MKRIMNSLLLLFLFPIKILKKTRIDNFVGGLIFGALFSLVVNIFTVQIQETLNKQLYLEAVEHEIVNHYLQSLNYINKVADILKNNGKPNYFSDTVPVYTTTTWENADTVRYIVALDPKIQGSIMSYYSTTVPGVTSILIRDETLTTKELEKCYFDFESLTKDLQDECMYTYYSYLKRQIDAVDHASQIAFNVLGEFHPTQDRLSSPLLRMLIGKEAVPILMGVNVPSK